MKKIEKTQDEKQGYGELRAKEEHSETLDELFLCGMAKKCPEIERVVCSKLDIRPWFQHMLCVLMPLHNFILLGTNAFLSQIYTDSYIWNEPLVSQ